uniref:Putative secreted protein n=1 Tax=Rhipicephalus microplus TaxID=6941 RepID=A0A6G5A2W7_RHIMP
MLLPRWKQAEETHAAFRMSCLKSLGVVLALQVAAAWATSVTPAPGAAAAAPAVGTAAVNGTPHHAAAESATASAAAAAGHGHFDTTQKTHKCTNVKLFSECRVHCEYVIDGKGAYFIFTDGEDGVPCKTRTLDGQVLNGACQQGRVHGQGSGWRSRPQCCRCGGGWRGYACLRCRGLRCRGRRSIWSSHTRRGSSPGRRCYPCARRGTCPSSCRRHREAQESLKEL